MLLRQTKQPPRRSPSVAELVDTCVAAVTSAALGDAISTPYVHAAQYKCKAFAETDIFWWTRLGWHVIGLRVREQIEHKSDFYALLSRALKSLGFALRSEDGLYSLSFFVQPMSVEHATTVQDLDLIWELGAHTIPTYYSTRDLSDCSCKGRCDPLCSFHSHASLFHTTNSTEHDPLEWRLLRAWWTPLRGAWLAACVAC
jgi:hypothetical protein